MAKEAPITKYGNGTDGQCQYHYIPQKYPLVAQAKCTTTTIFEHYSNGRALNLLIHILAIPVDIALYDKTR